MAGQVEKPAPKAQASKAGGLSAAFVFLRGLVLGFASDIRAVGSEIVAFCKKSCEVCEAGSVPWLQATAVFCITVLLSGEGCAILAARPAVADLRGSYWLTRVCSTRLLAFVYIWAFAAALFQNKALIGDRGILPARQLLQRGEQAAAQSAARWLASVVPSSVAAGGNAGTPKRQGRLLALMKLERLPTLLWLAEDREKLDPWLDAVAMAGLVLSTLAFVGGGASAVHLLAIWVLYHSIVSLGQRWYSFGWESQILETTLLASLAAPWGTLSCAGMPAAGPPCMLSVWAFRWLSFRIILGAGLIKVRGSRCWLNLTAMCHHIETQPIPNPLSRYFHNLPRKAMLFATASNHLIELVAPWFLLVPWLPCQAAYGCLHVFFQATLILSGNLSFLNWLTIIPGLWCLDDAVLAGLLPGTWAQALAESVRQVSAASSGSGGTWLALSVSLAALRDLAALAVICWLSIPVYQNLLGPHAGGRQVMNAAFDRKVDVPWPIVRRLFLPRTTAASNSDAGAVGAPPAVVRPQESHQAPLSFNLRALRLLNTYGAFGSVQEERVEIVFEGCREDQVWKTYTFKAAVDDPMKRPTWVSPYHLRLDWCRWIASCRGRRATGLGTQEAWVLSFAAQLLMRNPLASELLQRRPPGDPFEKEVAGPKFIRASLYAYRFAPPPKSSSEPYWLREYVGEYLPPVNLPELVARLDSFGITPLPPKAGG